MVKYIIIIQLFIIIMICNTNDVCSYERHGNITPSQVVSLWININETIPLLAKDAMVEHKLRKLKPEKFTEKTPDNVYLLLGAFREKLNQYREQNNLEAVKVYKGVVDSIDVTPAIVYVNSGHILDSIMDLLWYLKPKEQSYRTNYKKHFVEEKTPNDSYSLIELSNRIIDKIMQR